MDTESSHSQDNDFAQSPWVDMGGFHPAQQSPPLDDYHGFPYGVIPLDSAYGVTIPPPYASLPLTLPSNTWPSMLTNHQSHFPEGGLPPVPIPPSSVSPVTPIPPPRKSSTSSSTPRRTLTDEDRRRMCLYHEENKTAKQTDIGALFGVERSTVSKVLRQKEKSCLEAPPRSIPRLPSPLRWRALRPHCCRKVHLRPRTLPINTIDPHLMSAGDSTEQVSPKTTLESPLSANGALEQAHNPRFTPTLDTSTNTIKRNRSNPEIKTKTIYPPLFSKSTTVSPISSPGSPTQDEARKALELVMSYFEQQPTGLGAQEYLTIGKLMERLELAKAQHITLPGGLTRIDEHEDGPHLHKKRSIHSLG
ncbi:hypothetical protein BDW42DRAFT_39635 [Aspergillus taichungensis]|uniref:Uncharacterized protein n=1 Tax=Aspergillus taichungensis TaxID=482145 RepID=A0A2J5I3N3_9EURO|nr:hypothetical protein BDW42DRAFT_39635 [Aspergillus taichungensis]